MSEALIEYSKRKLPLIFTPGPIAGATSPVTLAGTLVQQNAEALSGIILSQIITPGTPNIYGSASSIMDMRTGTLSVGSPESILLTVAGTQIAKYYGLPSRASCTLSDAKVPDAQAGYEKGIASVLSSLVGLNLSTWIGLLESLLTTSPAQMVIDNEIWGIVQRIHRGIDVTSETLAVRTIAECTERTSFLGHPHTLEYHGREQWLPALSDRSTHGAWKDEGERSTLKRAAEEAHRIIKTHQPEPLDKDILSELERVALIPPLSSSRKP
jgi:trimethylamine--corrinoid protein Co-methyltransferase